MQPFQVLFAITVISIFFTLFSIYRLAIYIQHYRLQEVHYRRILGFIRLHWIAGLYILATFMLACGSFFTLFKL